MFRVKTHGRLSIFRLGALEEADLGSPSRVFSAITILRTLLWPWRQFRLFGRA